MTTKRNADARLADLAAATLTAAEQRHIEQRGEAPLADAAPVDAPDSTPERAPDSAPSAEPDAPAPVAAEPAAGEPASTDASDTKTKTVPHAALHEERALRKEAERRAQLLEERTNLLLQKIRAPGAAVPPTGPSVPAPPSYEQDRDGHIRGTLQAQNMAIQALLMDRVGLQNAMATQVARNELASRAATAETEFARETPDFTEAMTYLRGMNDRFLAAAGYAAPERSQILENQKQQLARKAIAEGRNPAAVAYEMAKAVGWKGPVAVASAGRLSAVERGQRQGGTLSQVRGTGPAPLTAQRLLEMSDSEFTRAIATPEGRALLGA